MLTKLRNVLIALWLNVKNRLPEPLPVTDEAVTGLIERVITGCGLDPANESLQNAIASTLLSLPQGTKTVKASDLIAVVDQARCKQAAYSIIEAIRTKDKEAREKSKQEADSSVGPEAS
jgi:hypothetical protein